MTNRRSLRSLNPWRWDIPVMIITAMGLLFAGMRLPTLKLTKIIFFTDTYSLWGSIWELWKSHHPGLAGIILFFSIIFPFTKLVGLFLIWLVPMKPGWRRRLLNWFGILGKWSMLDVFIVASLIVLVKVKDIANASAQIGIYLFAGAIALSMIVTTIIERVASRDSKWSAFRMTKEH